MIIDEWKSVISEIPPLDKIVLLCSKDGDIYCGFLTDVGEDDYFWCISNGELDQEYWYAEGFITHWTNPPKGPNR